MAKITHIKKYDLQTNTFIDEINKKTAFDALSYVREEYLHDEEDKSYEYIIFANGYRVKDVTIDGNNIYGSNNFARRIVNYFKKKKKNVVVIHLLVDKDAPLDLESQLLANYIDEISKSDRVRTISLIGHSKCGVMAFNTPKYFKSKSSYDKSSIYTSAAPFSGCLIASPKLFLRRIKETIFQRLPKPFNELTYSALKRYYNSTSSNSHMDYDIALPDSVQERYDPNFIKEVFDRVNIDAIKKVRHFHNFITAIDETSIFKSLKKQDYTGVGLCLVDRFFMDETTDGFIELSSQESIGNFMDISSKRVPSATHNYLSNDEELFIILDKVNDNIDEDNEKSKQKRLIR